MLDLKNRVKIRDGEDSTTVVEVDQKSWVFAKRHFALLFANKVQTDAEFYRLYVEHHNQHDWTKCEPQTCSGALWQIIQGLE